MADSFFFFAEDEEGDRTGADGDAFLEEAAAFLRRAGGRILAEDDVGGMPLERMGRCLGRRERLREKKGRTGGPGEIEDWGEYMMSDAKI